MKANWFVLAVAGIAAFAGAAAAQPAQKVRIATEGAFPPYNYTEPNGTLGGYEIELYKDLCARAKLDCTIEAQAFDGMIPALNAGKFDAIMAGMSITPRREEAVLFSQPYSSVGQIFMTLKSGPIGDLGDTGSVYSLTTSEAAAIAALDKIKPKLKGKVIGVQTSTIGAAFLKQYLEGTVEIREYKTTEQHDLDLTAGRVDAVFASIAYLSESKKKLASDDVLISGPRFMGGLLGKGAGVAFRKGETALQARFDAAIDAAKADGTIKRLSMKYFGFDVTPR
ncbi:MAG: transporter substrate-binding domain-containing protein [Proteobacteria bacterium]|nr:transporter substrate-binding domain-containing protein [Pseudomonadota bacterium]